MRQISKIGKGKKQQESEYSLNFKKGAAVLHTDTLSYLVAYLLQV